MLATHIQQRLHQASAGRHDDGAMTGAHQRGSDFQGGALDAAEAAAGTARATFEQGLAAETLPAIVAPLPAPLLDLAVAAGLAASKGEARRLLGQSGLRLNDAVVTDPQREVTAADLQDGAAKLSAGRKRHVLVRPAA